MQVLARRRAYTLIEFLVVLGITAVLCGLLGVIVWPLYSKQTTGRDSVGCLVNLKKVGLGFLQYAQDHDERFSPAATGPSQFYGWADALQIYIKSAHVYRCPVLISEQEPKIFSLEYWLRREPKAASPKERGYTDYWMNTRLSRIEMKDIASPAQLILSGDGNDGTHVTNARYTLASLPKSWREDKASPMYRHRSMMNILFADGHVKAVREAQLPEVATDGAHYTFDPSWRY